MPRFRAVPVLLLTAAISLSSAVLARADDAPSPDAWKQWKSIDAAIALRPLDGPDDIVEKAEIIEDRVDDLAREKTRLQAELDSGGQRLDNLRRQREALQDLAEIQRGGDPQTRQRLHDLAGRIRREETRLADLRSSLAGLEKELERMRALAADYRAKAETLKQREGGRP
ncbi:MAG: hypothetical protein M5R36_07170 [Deltaproteobacteria bacterium]|nr:hypothetical protein [Deltaproteobacteria bacterium]